MSKNILYSIISLLFCAIVSILPYYGIGSSLALIGSTLCVIIACIIPINVCLYCICFAYPFSAVLLLPIGLSITTILELIFIIRTLTHPKIEISSLSLIGIGMFVFFSQLIPFLIFDLSISKIFVLCYNILIFLCVYKISKKNQINQTLLYLSFALGVLISCFISLYTNNNADVDPDYIGRFVGLWTDPNFLGMFCMLSIVALFSKTGYNLKKLLLSIPIIAGLSYWGLLTQSRTFLIVYAFFIVLFLIRAFYKLNLRNILIGVMIIAGIINSSSYVIETLMSRNTGRDWTNGRLNDTQIAFDAYCSDWRSLLFGVGFDNEANFLDKQNLRAITSHNTYADILIELGAIFVLGLCISLATNSYNIKKYTQKIFTQDGYPFLTILIYAGALSLLKYEVFYIFSALFFIDNKKQIGQNETSPYYRPMLISNE